MHKVFIAEDDESIRELVIYALKSNDFDVAGFETGELLFDRLSGETPDIILLDIMLPGSDGLTILRMLRANKKYKGIPVIMLTAKGSEYDKVKGLDMGADDYVAKPFGVMELISRIKAVLRRAPAKDGGVENLVYKTIALDETKHEVCADGKTIALTFKEYELLRYLLINSGAALSRDKLMDAVWGFDSLGETRTVDMHIKTLRQKLGAAGEHIKTVRGVGYKIGE
jgi:two-component system alkaline phosphatase synthesis response regulator PhoP